MKYNTFEILKNVAKAIEDPMQFGENIKNFSGGKMLSRLGLEELNKSVGNFGEESEAYEESQYDNTSNEMNSKQGNTISHNEYANYNKQSTSKNGGKIENENLEVNKDESLGFMDSITEEITLVRLQQAIILSEIVSKPRCKTRKRRRF